jgi:hypothetical protein
MIDLVNEPIQTLKVLRPWLLTHLDRLNNKKTIGRRVSENTNLLNNTPTILDTDNG